MHEDWDKFVKFPFPNIVESFLNVLHFACINLAFESYSKFNCIIYIPQVHQGYFCTIFSYKWVWNYNYLKIKVLKTTTNCTLYIVYWRQINVMAYGAVMDYGMVGLWWHDESNTFNQTLETVWNKDVDLTLYNFSVARNIHCCLNFMWKALQSLFLFIWYFYFSHTEMNFKKHKIKRNCNENQKYRSRTDQ